MKRYIGALKRIFRDHSYLNYYVTRYKRIIELIIAFLFVQPIKKKLYKREIWLIGEKGTEARDNGYHFYKYIREKHPEINAFFTITKKSTDYAKVVRYGTVIQQNSFKHFVYYLVAKVSANSQPYGAIPEPSGILYKISRNLHRKDQIVIHLKHGITKDELPHELDYSQTGFDLICCVSERERRFMQDMHGYPDDKIKTLGFCRYDNLLSEHSIKKQILIMPTHRMWLHAVTSAEDATEEEKKVFKESEYYKMYSSLLSNNELLDCIKEAGYTLIFYPHYALQPYVGCFEIFANEVVSIADRDHFDVQELLLSSALLITDYSSVFFDFAYMGKPVIYFQFDEQKYRAGHFKKGYFDYYSDGFGPVLEDERDVVTETVRYMSNNCLMNEEYKHRADLFFSFRDTNNCERVFNEVHRKATEK